jgi:TM2 domain-containing membrane protein YozV
VKSNIFLIFFFFFNLTMLFSQEEKLKKDDNLNTITVPDSIGGGKQYTQRILRLIEDPLTPSKAAFYSAIIPGLGQVYIGKSWKVPMVYAAIGASLYYYDLNNKEMDKYRTAYKRRKNGFFDDEFLETDIPITTEQLLLGMDFHKNYRDISMILAAAAYMLNILDANVSAHLLQFNVNDDLSVAPNLIFDPEMTGLRLAIKFN